MPGPPDRSDRVDRGRAARRDVPRGSVALWTPSPHRSDPVDLLRADAATRVPALLPERFRRLCAGRSAFLRGSVAVHAADLAALPVCGLGGWGWGDAHAAGLVVTPAPDGRLVLDVDRYDESVPAPFEWDVVRLAVTLVAAGRDRGLPSAATRTLAFTAAASYAAHTHRYASLDGETRWHVAVDPESLHALADKSDGSAHRAPGVTPTTHVPGGGGVGFRHDVPGVVPVTDDAELHAATRAFDDLREGAPDDARALLEQYAVADVAALARGLGGLGRVVLAVLLRGLDDDDLVVCEVRETVASALAPYTAPSVHPALAAGPGARVVAARRLLGSVVDPFLGWVEGPFGRQYVWRRLPEQAWSPNLGRLGGERLRRWADRGGAALARAHARGGDPVAVAAYLGGSDRFPRAVADHAEHYTDVVESDLAAVRDAVARGDLPG